MEHDLVPYQPNLSYKALIDMSGGMIGVVVESLTLPPLNFEGEMMLRFVA